MTLPPLPYEADPNATGGEPYKPQTRPHVRYSEELAQTIFDRMTGGESISAICRDEGMPHVRAVMYWIVEREDFRDRYSRAMEARAYAMAEEILDIADDASGDVLEGRMNAEFVARSKLRVDTRKWLMARMAPRKYGDKITQEHVGKDGGALVVEILKLAPDANPTA